MGAQSWSATILGSLSGSDGALSERFIRVDDMELDPVTGETDENRSSRLVSWRSIQRTLGT
jgi:hypothetical protein